jgi:hypothetical protein
MTEEEERLHKIIEKLRADVNRADQAVRYWRKKHLGLAQTHEAVQSRVQGCIDGASGRPEEWFQDYLGVLQEAVNPAVAQKEAVGGNA